MNPTSSKACTDFTDLVIDDSIALEGDQTFTILVGNSMAMVTIVDNDGEFYTTISSRLAVDTEMHTSYHPIGESLLMMVSSIPPLAVD